MENSYIGHVNLRGAGSEYKTTVMVWVTEHGNRYYITRRKYGPHSTHLSDIEARINGEIDQGDIEKLSELLAGDTIYFTINAED